MRGVDAIMAVRRADSFAKRSIKSSSKRAALRLAMSMQRSPPAGVRIDTVWLKLRSLCKDWATLAVRTGWDAEDVTIADLYRSSPAKYHFSGLVEILDRFGYSDGQDFQMVRLATGGGPLAAQCPVVTFERL